MTASTPIATDGPGRVNGRAQAQTRRAENESGLLNKGSQTLLFHEVRVCVSRAIKKGETEVLAHSVHLTARDWNGKKPKNK